MQLSCCISTMKVRHYYWILWQVTRPEFIYLNQNPRDSQWNGTTQHCWEEISKKVTICWGSYGPILGLGWGWEEWFFSTSSSRRKHKILTVTRKHWRSLEVIFSKFNHKKGKLLFLHNSCHTSLREPLTRLHNLARQSCHIPHTVPILHLWNFICLGHCYKLFMDIIFMTLCP